MIVLLVFRKYWPNFNVITWLCIQLVLVVRWELKFDYSIQHLDDQFCNHNKSTRPMWISHYTNNDFCYLKWNWSFPCINTERKYTQKRNLSVCSCQIHKQNIFSLCVCDTSITWTFYLHQDEIHLKQTYIPHLNYVIKRSWNHFNLWETEFSIEPRGQPTNPH